MSRPPLRPKDGNTPRFCAVKEGWNIYTVHEQIFEIPERYELVSCVGKGAFGVVASAKIADESLGQQMLAIKKIIIREDNILEVKRYVFFFLVGRLPAGANSTNGTFERTVIVICQPQRSFEG